MKKVFINACAAKEGGALSIVEGYVKECDPIDFYYIVSPTEPTILPINSKWIEFKTNNIYTFIYTVLFSYFHAVFYCRASKIISFNNYNCLFSFLLTRVTYFHNILIVEDSSLKYKVIRFYLKFFNQSSCDYIFQTSYVSNMFKSILPGINSSTIIHPKVDVDFTYKSDYFDFSQYAKSINLLIPITDVNFAHKNINLIYSLAKKTSSLNIVFFVTADGVNFDNVIFIGKKCKSEFLYVMSESNGIVISSLFETFCLPIFEAISLNVPVYILDRPYISGLEVLLKDHKGFFKFSDVNSFASLPFKKN